MNDLGRQPHSERPEQLSRSVVFLTREELPPSLAKRDSRMQIELKFNDTKPVKDQSADIKVRDSGTLFKRYFRK